MIEVGNFGQVAALASAEQGAVVLVAKKKKAAAEAAFLSQALIPFVSLSGATDPPDIYRPPDSCRH